MPTLGITGGVASGKSTFTSMLAGMLDAEVFDADRCVHRLLESETVISEITKTFGPAVLDEGGKIDRAQLGDLVFADNSQRQRLEQILHPPVRSAWREKVRQEGSGHTWLLVDIPLLFETSADDEIPFVLLVGCSRETQLDRLIRLRHTAPDRALQMIDAQMPLPQKIARASQVVWNDGSLAALRGEVSLCAAALNS